MMTGTALADQRERLLKLIQEVSEAVRKMAEALAVLWETWAETMQNVIDFINRAYGPRFFLGQPPLRPFLGPPRI